jgi:hypothetical protein
VSLGQVAQRERQQLVQVVVIEGQWCVLPKHIPLIKKANTSEAGRSSETGGEESNTQHIHVINCQGGRTWAMAAGSPSRYIGICGDMYVLG